MNEIHYLKKYWSSKNYKMNNALPHCFFLFRKKSVIPIKKCGSRVYKCKQMEVQVNLNTKKSAEHFIFTFFENNCKAQAALVICCLFIWNFAYRQLSLFANFLFVNVLIIITKKIVKNANSSSQKWAFCLPLRLVQNYKINRITRETCNNRPSH